MNKNNIKTREEIKIMRKAGKILSEILSDLKSMIKPDLRVWDLEERFIFLCKKYKVLPACKNFAPDRFPPFPTGLCVSINSQSVHCFPRRNSIIKEGDIINVDTVIALEGLNVDSAFCSPVGKVSAKTKKFLETSEKALNESILNIKDGVKIGVISNTLQKTTVRGGFNVLKEYAGHGIGYHMHEEPEIPCYGKKNEGPRIKEGMTICIEALTCSGDDKITNMNAWETKMSDNGLFCIFEHTVLVTKDGYEVLTK